MGLSGVPAGVEANTSLEKVIIKDAYDELLKIFNLERGNKIICKIDCEGAEYEILARMLAMDALGFFDVYLIEWHKRETGDADKLADYFSSGGFHCIKKRFESLDSGMIYAFKK
jgi:hypothetical protein